jgi:hypothetical protein
MAVCDTVIVTPSPKSVGQDFQAQRKLFMKHFANGTSSNSSLSVASQWLQNERVQRNCTQHLSNSTHTVTKRSFPPAAGNNAVSRNITTVLEDLLKDYDSSQLPNQGKGNNFFDILLTVSRYIEL